MRVRWQPVALVVFVAVLAACGSSGSSKSAPPATSATGGSTPTTISAASAQGVTADQIKLGILMIDFDCIKQYNDNVVRPDQEKTFRIYIDDINNKGGIANRKVVPVFKSYCPVNNQGELAACTSLAEDSYVFATVGTFYDPSGDAQSCFAKKKIPIVADSLTEELVKKNPPGLIVTPNIAAERRLRVIMSLLKKQGTLTGKKVAIVSDTSNKGRAASDVKPALADLGVERGADASLSITGADTTAAMSQLDSFVERWKADGTNALILVGEDVSSKQFVEKIKGGIPGMLLVSDTTSILDGAKAEQKAHRTPNPYDGAITAEGQTGLEHTKTPHFAFCRDIWENVTGKKVPSPNVVVKLPNGDTNDLYGEVEDACLFTNFFATIAKKVGPNLNVANWQQTVDNFGPIDDMSTIYASIHQGKYDADDTYGLVAVDPTQGEAGDWKHLTPVQNVTGS